jgi:transcription elongation factor GreA
MSHTRLLTPTGHAQLARELSLLQQREIDLREEVTRMRELGDLSENAGYRAAKSSLHQVQSRIRHLQQALESAKIASPTAEKVSIGTTVHLQTPGGELKVFTIVDSAESDIFRGKITPHSPLGKLLLHRVCGEVVQLPTSHGVVTYTITAITVA